MYRSISINSVLKGRGGQTPPDLCSFFFGTLLLLIGTGCFSPVLSLNSSPPDISWSRSTSQATTLSPPEAILPLCDIHSDLERLVIRGDLPLEALTFQPIDRGELSAWLSESRTRRLCTPASDYSSSVNASHHRLTRNFSWDQTRWLSPGSNKRFSLPRPGYRHLYSDRQSQLLFAPYLRLAPVLRDPDSDAWTDSTRIGFRTVLYAGRSTVLTGGFYIAEINRARRFADPLVAGTDFILYESSATLSTRLGALRFRFGRDTHQWGPGAAGTLLFSGTAEPMNFAEYQFRLGGNIRFLALTAVTSLHQKRYIALHRLTWTPRSSLSFSLSEGARYQANGLHLLYLSGIVPYTLVERFDLQDNLDEPTFQQQRNNVFWCLDAAWRPGAATMLYGEILIDDIATETSTMPTRGGYQFGFSLAPAWRNWDWTLGAEYTRISDFTYSVFYQDLCLCDWEHQGTPVGFPAGPDLERLLVRCLIDPDPQWGSRCEIEFIRRGAGRIGRPWSPVETGCSPCENDCGPVSAWSLPADADQTLSGMVAVYWYPASQLRAAAWMKLSCRRGSAWESRHDRRTDRSLGLSFGLGGY